MNIFRKHLVTLTLTMSLLLSLPWAYAQWVPPPEKPAPAVPGIISLNQVAEFVYPLVNTVRRQHGLPALARDPGLEVVALTYSRDMLRRKFFGHTNPEGLSLMARLVSRYQQPFTKAGENIWTGSGYDLANAPLLARMMMQSWLDSPGHRDNLLDPRFTHLGVGVAARGREVRATQLFIQRPTGQNQ
ncbi:MAG: CAP domain-containing protein [Thermodesulfobacteriota bacterium]